MNCRFGTTALNATYALLHFAVLGWFLYSTPSAPRLLRALNAASSALTVALYVLLGSICSSLTVHDAVQAQFVSSPFIQVIFLYYLISGLVTCAVAAQFVVLKSNGTARAAQLTVLSMMAAINTLVVCWWGLGSLEAQYAGKAKFPVFLMVVMALPLFTSPVLIYCATKSRVVAFGVLVVAPTTMIAQSVLNMAFPINPLEHTLLHPNPSDSDQHPHWSVTLRGALSAMLTLSLRAGISHAGVISQPQRNPSPFDFSLTKLKSKWLWWLSAVMLLDAVAIQSWNTPSTTSNQQHTRELLAPSFMEAEQPQTTLSLPWFLVRQIPSILLHGRWSLVHLSLPCALLVAAFMVMKAKGSRGPRRPPRVRGMLPTNFGNRSTPVPDLPETYALIGCMPQIPGIPSMPQHSDTSNGVALIHDSLLASLTAKSLQPTSVGECSCSVLDSSLAALLEHKPFAGTARNIEKRKSSAETVQGISMGIHYCCSEASEQARNSLHCPSPLILILVAGHREDRLISRLILITRTS